MPEPVLYGGQAVIEGVMMVAPDRMAIAVRKPDGQITVKTEPTNSILRRVAFFRLPVVRGFVRLIETLSMGYSALMYSASEAAPEEEKLSPKETVISSIIGVGGAILLFFILPTLLTSWVRRYIGGGAEAGPGAGSGVLVHLLEGCVRIAILLTYLKLVSLMKDIHRVYQYHGAEHKVINAFEAGDELTVERVQRHSLEHKRCGTSFLLYVMVVSIVVYSFFGWPNVWLRIATRLIGLPIVAGISFEIIRLMGRYNNGLVNLLSRPGMWLQGLTTRQPDDSQVEVAIVAFNTARGVTQPG